ncbi:MAG: hypothetical protein OEV66_07435 [Spirochaetia bacterium]|nr:hypothetical protein [Spirochaetia bacterium]
MEKSPILVLGKISGTRSIKGALRIIKRGTLLDDLLKVNKKPEIELFKARSLKDGFLMEPEASGRYQLLNLHLLSRETAEIKLAGIDTIQEALALKGHFIGMSIDEARLNFHDPDDPYLFEYIGLQIFEGDICRGQVLRVEEFNDKQWIISDEPEEAMIPLQGPYIQSIDFQHLKIILHENTGLFEFNENP